jgi:hypothetical protein
MQFPDHSVPFASDRIQRSVRSILLDPKSIIEAEHQREFMDQIDSESFEPIIADQLFGSFLQHPVWWIVLKFKRRVSAKRPLFTNQTHNDCDDYEGLVPQSSIVNRHIRGFMGPVHFQMIDTIPGSHFYHTQVVYFDHIEQEVRSMAEFIKFDCPRQSMDRTLQSKRSYQQ